jgi:hypothetical protein
MRRALLFLALCVTGCNDGPCGDPVIECWSAKPNTCPPDYLRYTGSARCPIGYWCVDPRDPAPDDMAFECRDDDLSVPRDMSSVD